jgi:hypothetical protein
MQIPFFIRTDFLSREYEAFSIIANFPSAIKRDFDVQSFTFSEAAHGFTPSCPFAALRAGSSDILPLTKGEERGGGQIVND